MNFRYYVSGVARRNDSQHGELFRYAHDLYNGTLKFDDLLEKLREFIAEHAGDEALKGVLVSKLHDPQQRDFYYWHGLRYFLARYEASLTDKSESKCLSNYLTKRTSKREGDHTENEHIWAKDMDLVMQKDSIGYDTYNKQRLGNFTLLNRAGNSKAGKDLIEDKLAVYDQSSFKSTQGLSELFDAAKQEFKDSRRVTSGIKTRLYTHFLDLVEKRYVDFALEEWRI